MTTRVDEYTGPGEFLTITPAKDDWAKVERHVTRYLTAVGLAGRTGGRWLVGSPAACGVRRGPGGGRVRDGPNQPSGL